MALAKSPLATTHRRNMKASSVVNMPILVHRVTLFKTAASCVIRLARNFLTSFTQNKVEASIQNA